MEFKTYSGGFNLDIDNSYPDIDKVPQKVIYI